MNMPDAVVIGNIIKETIVEGGRATGPVLGSPAAYSSLAMAAAGCPTGLVSFYGGDMPEQIRELEIVDLSGLVPHAHSTTNTLTYAADGTKTVTFEKKAPDLGLRHIPERFLEASIFHVCPMDYEVELDLVEELMRRGKTVVVDLGGYGGATSLVRHSIHTDIGREAIGRLCGSGAYVKASSEDLASIFPGHDLEQAAAVLLQQGAGVAFFTLGPRGAMYAARGHEPVVVPGYVPTSRMPDGSLNPTGAGDSFDGGLVVALCGTGDIAAAVRFGNALASLAIEGPGGCIAARMPSREQVLERMRQQPVMPGAAAGMGQGKGIAS
jgi:sugar/nucleoside kinase (ribokinase family)